MRWLFHRLFFGIIYLAISVGLWIVKHCPRQLVYLLSDALADLSYYLCQRLRKRSIKNLRMALGDQLDVRAASGMVRKSLRNFSRTIVELGHALSAIPEELQREIPVVGWEYMEKALARGKGVIAPYSCINFADKVKKSPVFQHLCIATGSWLDFTSGEFQRQPQRADYVLQFRRQTVRRRDPAPQ